MEARLLTPISSYAAKPGLPDRSRDRHAGVSGGRRCAGGRRNAARRSLKGPSRRNRSDPRNCQHGSSNSTSCCLADGSAYPVQSHSPASTTRANAWIAWQRFTASAPPPPLSNRVGQHIAFLAMGHPAAMLPLLVAESAMFHFPEPEIELTRGADLHLSVEFPPAMGRGFALRGAARDLRERLGRPA